MKYDNKIKEEARRIKEEYNESNTDIAKKLIAKYSIETELETLRKRVGEWMSEAPKYDDILEEVNIDPNKVKQYWYKGKHYSINVDGNERINWSEVRDKIIEEMKNHSPSYDKWTQPNFTRSNSNGHLLVIDPCDVHIGKLSLDKETGDEYNNNIAVSRVIEGVEGILRQSSGFYIEAIVFIGGNDILHIDSPSRKTTSGTPQDTDGMWYNNFLIAKKLYVDIIERLLDYAPVHFVFNPSNHDYTNGFFLADVISTWFSKHPNFTSDCSLAHRKYYVWHNNLIGSTHGDGAKESDLPLLMANECPEGWSSTSNRYIYTHHIHHKTAKDYHGVTVESVRSPSGTDSWHHRNGYQHAPKAIEAFVHNKDHGQVARLTYIFS